MHVLVNILVTEIFLPESCISKKQLFFLSSHFYFVVYVNITQKFIIFMNNKSPVHLVDVKGNTRNFVLIYFRL